MKRIGLAIKVKPHFKELLIRLAKRENRTLSGFIKHILKEYIRNKYGINPDPE